jgi:hypothetical protein
MFVVQSLIAQGIYVVLDYQPMVGLGGLGGWAFGGLGGSQGWGPGPRASAWCWTGFGVYWGWGEPLRLGPGSIAQGIYVVLDYQPMVGAGIWVCGLWLGFGF